MEPIIQFQNLSVVYDAGKSNETWALRETNLEIYPTEYVIFFGPSGCGKSTLLYVIAGLEKPSIGKAIIRGKDLTSLSEKELIDFHRNSIGFIFQAYHLIPNLNVKDNILLPQIFLKKPSDERLTKAKALMKRFDILDLEKKRPSQLSGGQQQRTAIVRALINDPFIILADEPVGNLDSKNAEIVNNLLVEFNQVDKKTIIHVTHDPRYLSSANRVFYMKDGRIVRVIVNPKKKTIAPLVRKEISDLEKLAQIYPFLEEQKLRTKMILNNILLPNYGVETLQKIEETIEDYLLGKISDKRLFEIFDQSTEKGGLDLYTQTARELTDKIVTLAKQIEIFEEKEISPRYSFIEEKAINLRKYLLDNYSLPLNFEQIKRFDELLIQRLIGKINKKELERLLDLPFKQGGVGIHRRRAKKFVREIELILMKK